MPALGRVAARLLAERSAAVGRGLERARSGRAADLHRLRIAVKKYRYTLELMHEIGFGRYARAIDAARRIQERLGRLHDVDVLLALLRQGRGTWRGGGTRPAIPAVLRRERSALVASALATAARFRPVTGAVVP
jgi:CHAD domain-containing protein